MLNQWIGLQPTHRVDGLVVVELDEAHNNAVNKPNEHGENHEHTDEHHRQNHPNHITTQADSEGADQISDVVFVFRACEISAFYICHDDAHN